MKFFKVSLVSIFLFNVLSGNQITEKSVQDPQDCCCPQTISINSGNFDPLNGYTILQSNTTYCIQSNLIFLGFGTAITVSPGIHDIIIDFNGFSLQLMTSSAHGIDLNGVAGLFVANVAIKNGRIFTNSANPSTDTTIAINMTDFDGVTIENMVFNTLNTGCQINPDPFVPTLASTNYVLKYCDFENLPNASFLQALAILNGMVSIGNVFTNCGSGLGGNFVISIDNAFIKDNTFRQCNTGIFCWSFNDVGGGIGVPHSNDWVIEDCNFSEISFISINMIGINNVQIKRCASSVAGPGISGSISYGADFSSLTRTGGLLVDGCTFSMQGINIIGNPAYYALRQIQIGHDLVIFDCPFASFDNSVPFAVIIRNSTFNSNFAASTQTLAMDILAFGADGLLIENNIFDSNSSGYITDCQPSLVQNPFSFPDCTPGLMIPEKSANIHLGSAFGQTNAKNVIIQGNILGTSAQVGIYATTGQFPVPNQNIVIKDNQITAAEWGILLENTIASQLINNFVSGVNGSACNPTGIGIQLSGCLPWNKKASSSCIALQKNTIVNNSVGIVIQKRAQGNLLDMNEVFNNSKKQICIKDKKKSVSKDNIIFKKPCNNPCGLNAGTNEITLSKMQNSTQK